MIKIIVHGCLGAMGMELDALLKDHPRAAIVAGVDTRRREAGSYPVYSSVLDVKEDAHVVIDFSTAGAVDGLLSDCRAKGLPLVLCTTGLSKDQMLQVEAASKEIALLRSANMSLGVNLLFKLAAEAAGGAGRGGL